MKGHVRARGKNTWALVIELDRDPVTGKRRQKWITVKGNKKEAERRLAQTLHEMNMGAYAAPAKVSLGAFLERWLEHVQTTVRPVTFDSYRTLVHRHITPTLGHMPLTRLQTLDLQQFYAAKLRDGRSDGKPGGLSPRTVRYLHGLLREALGYAVRWNLVSRNIAEAADPPRQSKRNAQALDTHEIQAFLAALQGDRLYAFYLLALTTGLRRGELLGLRWQDVDLGSGWLVVRQTLVVVNGKPTIQDEAKNRSSLRPVSLPAVAVEALRNHKFKQTEERMVFGEEYQGNDLVFCAIQGQPLNPSNLRRSFKRLLTDAGLPEIRIHDLRHTHATMLLSAGVNLKLVADRLGHSTTRMTADTYSHVLPRMRDEVAATVDKIFSPPEGLQTEGKRTAEGK